MTHTASDDLPTELAPPTPRPHADRLLTVGAVLGGLCLVATILALVLGLRPMIFETGSMAPAIPTGSLGISRSVPATSVHAGDVVSVIRDDGVRVTHRVESVSAPTGNSVSLTLRGDANDSADPRTYTVTEVQRIVGTAPLLGYVAAWLKNPYTLVLEGLAALLLLGVAFAPKRGWRNSPAGHRIMAGTAAATVAALGVSHVHGTGDANALTAQVTAAGGVTVVRPPNPSYTRTNISRVLGNTIRLSWPNPPENVAAGYTYKLSFPQLLLFDPIPAMTASSLDDPAQFEFSTGLISALLMALSGNTTVTLTVYAGNFTSTSLSHTIGSDFGLPVGVECKPPGTVTSGPGAAALRAAPESVAVTPTEVEASASEPEPEEAEASESAESSEKPSREPEPRDDTDGAATPTSAAAELPPGGTLTDAGDFAYYKDGSTITIRDAKAGDVEYRGTFSSSSDIRWLPGTSTLKVTEPDGTVTLVRRAGTQWRETVRTPETTEAPRTETTRAGAEEPDSDADDSTRDGAGE